MLVRYAPTVTKHAHTHTCQASRFLLSPDRQNAAIQCPVSRARPSRQAVCREGLARETIQRLSATIPMQLVKVKVSVSASNVFILHVQTIRFKLKGTAAKFCSANGKAIQQVNPTLAPLQLGMVRFGVDWQLVDNKKRLASQTVHVCDCVLS